MIKPFSHGFIMKIARIISTYVDDFGVGVGSEQFKSLVIEKIKNTFLMKSEGSKKFKYLGLDVEQHSEKIIVYQDRYVQNLKTNPTPLAFGVQQRRQL